MKEIIPGPWPFGEPKKMSPLRMAVRVASGIAIMGVGGLCAAEAIDQYTQPYSTHTEEYTLAAASAELWGGLLITDAIVRRREQNRALRQKSQTK